MEHIAFKMILKEGFEDEYKKRHDGIWPELAALLKESGIAEYHIFLDSETRTLFAVQKQSGLSSQDLGDNAIVKQWWAYMADIMETNTDNSPVSIPLQRVFYLE